MVKNNKQYPHVAMAEVIRLISRGELEDARKLLKEEVAPELKKHGPKLDLDKTMENLLNRTEKAEVNERPVTKKRFLPDRAKTSPSSSLSSSPSPSNSSSPSTSPSPIQEEIFSLESKLDELDEKGYLVFNKIKDNIDIESVVAQSAMKVNKDDKINYHNIAYGGMGVDITLKLENKMNSIFNADKRIDKLAAIIKDHGLSPLNPETPEINDKEFISQNNLETLMIAIANKVSASTDSKENKEKKLEQIAKELTQSLVNTNDIEGLSDLVFESGSLKGKNYVNFGHVGTAPNILYSNSNSEGLTTDQLIKLGLSDCRGTNMIYAHLLNESYKVLGSDKEARLIYTHMSSAPEGEDYTHAEDHNIVAVCDKKEEKVLKLKDAYFDFIDNIELKQALEMGFGESVIDSQGNNIEPAQHQFTIHALTPYPLQQKFDLSRLKFLNFHGYNQGDSKVAGRPPSTPSPKKPVLNQKGP